MRQAITPVLALLALTACSDSPVEPTTDVAPQFASSGVVTSVGGFLGFPDGVALFISAQSQCTDVCTVKGSVLMSDGRERTRFGVADLEVAGGLLPWNVTAVSLAHDQPPIPGAYRVVLEEIRPRDCEGYCPVTWHIDVGHVVSFSSGWVSIYMGTSDKGGLAVNAPEPTASSAGTPT